jgi:hypothetical protein
MWNMLESLVRQLRAVCVSYHRCDPQASEGAGDTIERIDPSASA